MPTPIYRTPVRIARGTLANLQANVADLLEGEICYAIDQNKTYVVDGGFLVEQPYLPSAGGALTGDLTLNGQSDLRLADADSSHSLGLQAPAVVASDVTWTLPAADGSSGQVLRTNGTGTLSWDADGVEQLNVLYVDGANGDDANDGHRPSTAKQTIKAAVAAASAGDIVKVAPGVYQETLPIDITVSNLSIVGDSTRSVFVHPTVATETGTMFRCNSGTYIEGFTFCGLKASGTRGTHPIDDDPTYGLPQNQGWVAGFYPSAVIRKSPWIENCTNFADSGIDNSNFDPNNYSGTGGDTTSAPTGGGVLVDGSLPDITSPLRSFVINEFTQVCLDGPGLLVCRNGYAQAVSYFGIFNHYQAKALSGGQINMEVGTTNFGRYALIADGKSDSAIFTATANGAATAGDVTFVINAPTAGAGWFGDATRPAINMLVEIGGDIYPILSSSPNGSGWNVTISRPDPTDRSINLGLINGHANGDNVQFYLRSMVSTASHTFEYAGAGTDYTALPENGGEPVETNEAIALNDGRVWLTSTDQAGKFKVGDTFQVDQQTGFVTIDPTSVSVNVVSDNSPQLGGDLDVLLRKITTSQGNTGVVIEGNGTGAVTLKSGAANKLVVGSSAIDAKVVVSAEGGVRFPDADASNYVAFQAPTTVSSNITWTLPAADGTSGQVLSTNGTGTLSWSAGGGGGASVTTSDTAPSTPADGDLWYNSANGRIYVYYDDGDSAQWVDASPQGGGGSGGGASVTTSDTAPSTPTDGDLWYDSVGGRLYVYYDDGNTNQWVDAAPQGGGDAGFSKLEVGNTKAEVTDTGSNGTFTVTTEGTSRLTVGSTGNVSIANGNLVFSTSGTGIDFSATANSSGTMTSELLSDYEEGTWTPNGNGVSFTTALGKYRKIGSLVVASFYVVWPSTSNTSEARIQGQPFTAAGANENGGGFISYENTSYSDLTLYAGDTSYFRPISNGSNLNNANLSGAAVIGTYIYCT
jgi:hypothetical protein